MTMVPDTFAFKEAFSFPPPWPEAASCLAKNYNWFKNIVQILGLLFYLLKKHAQGKFGRKVH